MNAEQWLARGLEVNPRINPIAAKVCFDRAMMLDPTLPGIVGHWLWGKLALCDWEGLDAAFQRLEQDVEEGRQVIPHTMWVSPLSPTQQLKGARSIVKATCPRKGTCPAPVRSGRIRVGYFGADFYEHATMYLMAGMFEAHDRSKFEVSIFSSSYINDDTMARRARNSVERFFDVLGTKDEEVVALARAQQLDIAVDLQGLSAGGGLGPFAHGLAPIQVSYLVYPGTTGADYIDYLIADATLIPPEQSEHYAEKVVYLPHSYQVNDRLRPVGGSPMMKHHFGLPKDGFVFCCFNGNWKITPVIFDVWMRLLKAVPGSVLWLMGDNNQAVKNLHREAEARGVARDRLVFAEHLPAPMHLDRHRWADLFLDTPNCGAHTMASDALWTGLPVLTLEGQTFTSRVGSSLLRAVDLPELITTSLEAYEAKALELANNPTRLRGFQEHLRQNRLKFPLFDTVGTTRQIESAYETMVSG